MNDIYLEANYTVTKSAEQLRTEFNEIIELRSDKKKFVNTEAALSWIVRGGIEYFDKLNSDFLGEGNSMGIPSMEADYFANNFYRVSNTLDYLGKLWDLTIEEPKEWSLLKDIRTLIVHSGEQLSAIESLEFKNYKDAQLGRIFKKGNDAFSKLSKGKSFDYRIQIWTDKHDNAKNRPENEVDYDNKNQNYRDIEIHLNSKDVKQIVFTQVEKFISAITSQELKVKPIKKLPEAVKNQVVNKLNFDKLESLIKKKRRGDYFIENEEVIWYGFGLKRLWEYDSYHFGISPTVKKVVEETISKRLEEFWNAYNDETISDYDLPSLDVRNVFKKYTPDYELKDYLESEKLFIHIAPTFNKKDSPDSTDVDYLLRFVCAAQEALGIRLNLENDVNGVVCDYFIKSIEIKLREEAETNGR